MSESRQIQVPKRKRSKHKGSTETELPLSSISSEEKEQKLKELDEFMESVLKRAGEEFLDEFKQVEGE
jgi:hypothetical protein